eukprot:TRINITY_DN30798_c0_g1_i1.p1 TRINITY_DN30798_c0_g1~~TRINITY_DN30798_c0_g1_i1.p1  ORF type:complete len:810 (-),score=154.60 TRINITY_DN30798_c0_g1_i1:331-2760(-)
MCLLECAQQSSSFFNQVLPAYLPKGRCAMGWDDDGDGYITPPPRPSNRSKITVIEDRDGSGDENAKGHDRTDDLAENPTGGRRKSIIRQTRKTGGKDDGDDHVKSTFVDAAAMKEKVRQNLSKPQYAVSDYYKETGICQAIARSPKFDKATLLVISFNALWIAIDTDMNDATLLLEAHPVFVLAENLFCAFFSFELFTRYMAFKRIRDGLHDVWFVFDTFMVTMMVMETWVFTTFTLLVENDDSGGGSNTSVLRVARLLRLSRMCRMARLLRAMPELMIMIKGMLAATRSVFFTLCLLFVFTYVFAIALKQLAEDTPLGPEHFPSVPMSMVTLMVYGVFLDSFASFFLALMKHPHLALMFFFFVLIGSLTILNMLVGVLCEVVSAVAATEQEEMLVTYVNDKLSRVMQLIDTDGGGSISKKEFMQILENVDAVRSLNDVGVDVFALVDLADYIFEDDDAANEDDIELDFGKFMEVVLQLRGTNQATVKDIVDLRKFMRLAMSENYKQSLTIMEELQRLIELQTSGATSTLVGLPQAAQACAADAGKPKRLSASNPFDLPGFAGKKDKSAVHDAEHALYEPEKDPHQMQRPLLVESGQFDTAEFEMEHRVPVVALPVNPQYVVETSCAAPALRPSLSQEETHGLLKKLSRHSSAGLQNLPTKAEDPPVISDLLSIKGDWLPVDVQANSDWRIAGEDEVTTAPPESRDAAVSNAASLDGQIRPLGGFEAIPTGAETGVLRGLGGLSSDRKEAILTNIQGDAHLQGLVEHVDKLCKQLTVGLVEFLHEESSARKALIEKNRSEITRSAGVTL